MPVVVLAERDKKAMDEEVGGVGFGGAGWGGAGAPTKRGTRARRPGAPNAARPPGAAHPHRPPPPPGQIAEALDGRIPIITRSGSATRLEDLRRAAVGAAGTVLLQYPGEDGVTRVSAGGTA
jgi:hypothetical protein